MNKIDAIALISEWVMVDATAEDASKQHFLRLYDIVKVKDTREETITNLNSAISDIKLNSRKKFFKATMRQVEAYVEYNTVVNTTRVSYSNIKKVCNLISYINRHKLEVDLHTELEGVYDASKSTWEYNNTLETTLNKVSKDNKVEQAKETAEQGLVYLDKCSYEAKVAMYERLVAELAIQIV